MYDRTFEDVRDAMKDFYTYHGTIELLNELYKNRESWLVAVGLYETWIIEGRKIRNE